MKTLTPPLAGNNRTIQAVRKADSLVRREVSGMPGSKATGAGSGGGSRRWAEITAVTDSNNYTADIYANRDEDPINEDVDVYVYDIVDELAVGDWIPVEKRNHGTGESIEKKWTCTQQLGVLG